MKHKTQATHLLNISSLSHDGRGIAQLEGKTVFVHGALTGEQVVCQIIKKHRRYLEGKVVEIIQPAPTRASAHCPHFGICGGCSLQHLAVSDQIALKQQTLLEQLQHFGRVVPHEILPPISTAEWGYRRKARLGVRFVHKKNKLLVGFREKWSHYLADIEQCPILHPHVGQRLAAINECISQLVQFQHIPQIEVAVGDDATAFIVRHLEPLPESDIAALRQWGETHQIHMYLQPNPPARTHKIWPLDANETLQYTLPDFQLNMHFHPADFTQVNGEINRLLVAQALQLLDLQPTDKALDLFCGLGNFTLPMARFAEKVCGVEGSQTMVERARNNALANSISNASFFMANLMVPPEQPGWAQIAYDKILLDPPRTGAKEILPWLARFAAKKIVYVSCNPATLARDAGELTHQLGYQLKKIGVINMFPHTAHIEAMALFEK